MRVLILSQYFAPEVFPITAFARALRDAGAEVTVLTGQPNYPDGTIFPGFRAASIRRDRLDAGIDVFRVPIAPRGRSNAFRLAANYLSFVASASLFGPWLLRGRPVDVVFVYAPSPIIQAVPGMVLRWVKRAKLVTWVQDLWPQSLESTGFVRHPALLSMADAVVRWIYRKHDLLLGQSRAFVAAIMPMSGGTPVEYLPNPGDASFETRDRDGTPALVLPRGFNVVFAGNLGTVQGLDTILDAAALLRDEPAVRFVLIGSGSRSAWLAEEVRRRSLDNVLLPGRFDLAAMPAILAQADALLASMKRSPILGQTIPSKVQAYLAAGRPILVSMDGEGADLVVAAGAGFASPAEDARALADNVRRLRQLDVDARALMGSAGRSFYDRHFHPNALAEQLLARFRDLATHNRPLPMTLGATAS